jgi:hypothetical protein
MGEVVKQKKGKALSALIVSAVVAAVVILLLTGVISVEQAGQILEIVQ